MTLPTAINPRVSIIIPCRNERGHIAACLVSILNQAAPEGGFEVIVADGMSDDGTREILKGAEAGSQKSEVRAQPDLQSAISELPSIGVLRVIDNPGRIVSKGLNVAIRAARGEIIVRLDAHTEYGPDYVQDCVATLQSTGADNVGGPARTKADTFLGQAIAAAYHSPFSVGGARFHDPDYEGYVETVTYGCWRRDVFERFGYFDEELARNQDDEHNLRIIRGGGKIYQSPSIKSWYRPRSSLRALFQQYLQYGYWKVRVIQKHKVPASWRHLVPGAFVLTLMALFLLAAVSVILSAVTTGRRLLSPGLSLLPAGLLVMSLAAYVAAVIAASIITAAKTDWKLFWILPGVFPCYHFGYGYGFLRGVWDFVIRRRGPQTSFQTLTR